MKKILSVLAIALAGVLLYAYAGHHQFGQVPSASDGHIGPAALYPDPTLSPGLIATADINELTQVSSCGTYSKCHRATTSQQKDQVRSEYPDCPTGAGQSEIDHIVPLALGGADDVQNLWCQPADNEWNGVNYGFHTKDALESYLASAVKRGDIAPDVAQGCILSDWVACYQQYIGSQSPSYGSVAPPVDPDDQ